MGRDPTQSHRRWFGDVFYVLKPLAEVAAGVNGVCTQQVEKEPIEATWGQLCNI